MCAQTGGLHVERKRSHAPRPQHSKKTMHSWRSRRLSVLSEEWQWLEGLYYNSTQLVEGELILLCEAHKSQLLFDIKHPFITKYSVARTKKSLEYIWQTQADVGNNACLLLSTVWKGCSRVITSTSSAVISHTKSSPANSNRDRQTKAFPRESIILCLFFQSKSPPPVQWLPFSFTGHCFGMWWYVGKGHRIPCWFTHAQTAGLSKENIICPVNVLKECNDLRAEREEVHQICHCGADKSNACWEKSKNTSEWSRHEHRGVCCD